MAKIVVYFLNILITLQCILAQMPKGDVKVELHNVVNCQVDSPWKWTHRAQILNLTHAMVTVDATINSPFDNLISITGQLQQLQGNKWKNVIKMTKKKACSTAKLYVGSLFNDITKEIGLPNAKCPIPKGHYAITDSIIDLSKISVLKVLSGTYKAKVYCTDQKKIVLFCVEVEGSVTPV